jgi:hypothetical protein
MISSLKIFDHSICQVPFRYFHKYPPRTQEIIYYFNYQPELLTDHHEKLSVDVQ